jgi:hypothetical protein
MNEVYGQCIHFHPLTSVKHLQLLTILLQLINNPTTNYHHNNLLGNFFYIEILI